MRAPTHRERVEAVTRAMGRPVPPEASEGAHLLAHLTPAECEPVHRALSAGELTDKSKTLRAALTPRQRETFDRIASYNYPGTWRQERGLLNAFLRKSIRLGLL